LSLFSFNLSSESSIDKFNNLINKDLSFVQKSLDAISNQYIESTGTLIHQDALIIVNIKTPYKEKYTINDTFIDVYDYDFEQSRVIQLDDIDTNMIHYLKNGITESQNIKVLSTNAIEINENNNKTYIEVLDEKRFLIKFKDNMNVTNLINFVVKT
jgi:outer membrane lipoprotein-sorting protein|tara:strand:+ start:4654 stop:5121 length:468 start_codon:yes stop_codon:yes gene_type:complete